MNEPLPTDIPPEEPDLEDHAIEMVPPLDPPDPFERDTPDDAEIETTPTDGEEIGDRLAANLDEMAVPQTRPTATRDLVHDMVEAGAEQEITNDLLRMELPPEEYTEADYEAASGQ
jgi:hypothetical protein